MRTSTMFVLVRNSFLAKSVQEIPIGVFFCLLFPFFGVLVVFAIALLFGSGMDPWTILGLHTWNFFISSIFVVIGSVGYIVSSFSVPKKKSKKRFKNK